MFFSSSKLFVFLSEPGLVGASLLAMDVNDDAFSLVARGVFEIIASKLAPTAAGFLL